MIIGFSSSNGLIGRIIKKLTRSKVSHTYIIFDAADIKLIIQADWKGVDVEYYEIVKQKNNIVAEYQILLNSEEEHLALGYAFQQLTKAYDYLAIIGFAIVLINKMFGRQIKQPFRNRSAYFCSELAITALQAANFPLSHSFDRELTSPEDVMEFLNSHPRAKLI